MKEISLYDVQTRRVICSHIVRQDPVGDIRFSSDGRRLLFVTCRRDSEDMSISLVELERGEDGNFSIVAGGFMGEDLFGGVSSWANLFSSHAWRCGENFEWVVDSRDNKVLWLPLSWRVLVKGLRDVRWDGNFLAFVGHDHPDPIVIKFFNHNRCPFSHL